MKMTTSLLFIYNMNKIDIVTITEATGNDISVLLLSALNAIQRARQCSLNH